MIFGDRHELAIVVERFDPPWSVVDTFRESVWGAVEIWVAGENLTEHRRIGTDRVREDVSIPLCPLARWFTTVRGALIWQERSPLGAGGPPHDDLERWSEGRPPSEHHEDEWLDLRDEWWSEHFTGSALQDVVAPSVGIVRNDDRALVSWRMPALPNADRRFVRPDGASVVSWDTVLSAFDDFAACVEDWAPSNSDLNVSAAIPRAALEYYTGLAADEIDQFGFLPDSVDDPATDPLAQIIRDLTRDTAVGPARGSVIGLARRAAEPAKRGWLQVRDRLLPPQQPSFEEDGYAAAQAARSILSLDGAPIDDLTALLRSLDIEVDSTKPPADDRMLAAATLSGRAVTMILANARTATPWGERFELARALGHLLLDPIRGEAVGAASGRLALPSRRRRTGAFAAEFLLPTTALEAASDGVLDGITVGERFPHLLQRFGVGANTAAYQLWNQGLLSSTEVRDDLIVSV